MESTRNVDLASSLINEPSPGVVERSILLAYYIKQIDSDCRDKLLDIKEKISFDELMNAIFESDKERVKIKVQSLYRKMNGNL